MIIFKMKLNQHWIFYVEQIYGLHINDKLWKLKNLAKLRITDGYGNMSRQQLESIFTALSVPKPVWRL